MGKEIWGKEKSVELGLGPGGLEVLAEQRSKESKRHLPIKV